jgi:hypothetical protein
MTRGVRNKYYILLSLLLILSLEGSSPELPDAETFKTAFNPPIVRGFNTSAFGDLQRVKDVYGANVVRLQLTPRTEAVGRGVPIAVAWENQLNNMETALKEAVREGMYVIIDLHEPPIADASLKFANSDPQLAGDRSAVCALPGQYLGLRSLERAV